MKNTLIDIHGNEIAIAKPSTLKSIEDIVTHNDTILTFDIYRSKRGNKKIWGRKIFFQALINLSLIERIGIGYKPTPEAQEKYSHWFVFIDNVWGFNPDAEDEIEDVIHRPLFKEQNKLLKLHEEEKRAKAKVKYEADKRRELQNQKAKGLF